MPISELPGDEEGSENCRTFVILNEGHTLGNALKHIISRFPDVEFCGYTVPHPAENKMHFRIQTTHGSAVEALKRGLRDLDEVCEHVENVFKEEVQKFHAKQSE